jgi:hypothetical protein
MAFTLHRTRNDLLTWGMMSGSAIYDACSWQGPEVIGQTIMTPVFNRLFFPLCPVGRDRFGFLTKPPAPPLIKKSPAGKQTHS